MLVVFDICEIILSLVIAFFCAISGTNDDTIFTFMFLYKLCLAFCTYTVIVTGSPFFTLIFVLSGSFIFSLSYDSSASNNCSLLDNLYILSPIWMLPFILPITTFSPILAFEMFALFIISSETLYFVFSFSKFIVSPTERG